MWTWNQISIGVNDQDITENPLYAYGNYATFRTAVKGSYDVGAEQLAKNEELKK